MISEQLDREFTPKNYDDLKKVYSIWIFFDAPNKDSDTITEYHLTKKDVYGKAVAGGNYDYLSISFIRLNVGKEKRSENQLIYMLDTIFSDKMDVEQKKKILGTEHQMIMTRELEGEIGSARTPVGNYCKVCRDFRGRSKKDCRNLNQAGAGCTCRLKKNGGNHGDQM